MRKTGWLLLCCTAMQWASAQYNFGFEEVEDSTQRLRYWNIKSGPSYFGPLFAFDTLVKHSGRQSLSIERRSTDTATQFTPASVRIPADFLGNRIRFSGWLKTENVSGYAQLWIRIDNKQGKLLRLGNYPRNSLKGSTDWMQFDSTLALPEDAHTIYFGFLLAGKGKVWADDLDIQVDGIPLEKIARNTKPVYPASDDVTEFANGSGIRLDTVTATQKKNLALLGKIWGFLKYYHPFIARGNLNWDYELFRFLPSYLPVTAEKERNALLLQWISKWEKPAPCKKCSEKELEKAVYKPDLDWIQNRTELGDDLSDALMYIRKNRHQGKSYYMDLEPGVGNPKILHEKGYDSMKYPDAGYRLLCLFRYWNLIQYWFPYKHLIGEDWKQVLEEFIPLMIGARDAAAYTVTTRRLIARVHDTHANVWGGNKILDSLKGRFYPPVKIRFAGEQAVISQVIHDSLAAASGLQRGDVIETINGRHIKEIITASLPDLPASNYPTRLRDLAAFVLRSNDSLSEITVRRKDKLFSTLLHRGTVKQIPQPYRFDFPYQRDSVFFFIQPGIGYLNLGRVHRKQVDSIFRALEGSAGLILDNRQYPSDFPLYDLAAKLVPGVKTFATIPGPSLDYPGAFKTIAALKVGSNSKKSYKGKLVLLVNENTQSSGEFHTMAFQQAPGAVVMGSTTAGADGNVSGFVLPGGIATMFSGISILYPDGKESQRVGIVPDIVVHPSLQGIAEGRDELLEKAIERIRTGTEKKGF